MNPQLNTLFFDPQSGFSEDEVLQLASDNTISITPEQIILINQVVREVALNYNQLTTQQLLENSGYPENVPRMMCIFFITTKLKIPPRLAILLFKEKDIAIKAAFSYHQMLSGSTGEDGRRYKEVYDTVLKSIFGEGFQVTEPVEGVVEKESTPTIEQALEKKIHPKLSIRPVSRHQLFGKPFRLTQGLIARLNPQEGQWCHYFIYGAGKGYFDEV